MKTIFHCLVILFFGLSALFAAAPEPYSEACFYSSDGKWELYACRGKDERCYSKSFLIHIPSGKSYPLMIFSWPKDIKALWSPDGHYLAVDNGSHTEVFSLEYEQPTSLGCPYKHGLQQEEPFDVSLLKEKDKKRYKPMDDADECSVHPREWANKTDLVFQCNLKAKLEATAKEPQEELHLVATVTIRMGLPGKERITNGKYEVYDKHASEAPEAFGLPLLPIPMTNQNQTPEGFVLNQQDEPPPQGLQLVHYRNVEHNINEIWLKDYSAKQMTRLYEYDRSARASLSADASSVVIVDRYASNATKIAMLLKDKEGHYRQLKTDGIAQKGVELMARIFKLKETPDIDHLYCNVLEPPDAGSQEIEVVIWGYESGKQELEHWFFSYDIATGKAFVSNEEETRKAGLPLKPITKNE